MRHHKLFGPGVMAKLEALSVAVKGEFNVICMNLGGFGHVSECFKMFQRVSTFSDTFSVPDLAGLDSTGAVPGFVGRSGEGVCSVQGVHSGKWRVHTECTL